MDTPSEEVMSMKTTISRLVVHVLQMSPLYWKWTLTQRLNLVREATISFTPILGNN